MKNNIEQIYEEYIIRKDNAQLLIDEVKYIISEATSREHIKVHSLAHRIKGFDSFLDKVKRKNLKDPFNEVHDLIGFRLICLFLEDINRIGDLLKRELNVFDIEDRIEEVSYDVFGYMASHYKARIKDESKLIGPAKDYIFELQVRTIAQDAWASISHYLEYKQERFLPSNLRRDFHALSGLFYIADTHFSLLRKEQLKFFVGELPNKDDGTASN